MTMDDRSLGVVLMPVFNTIENDGRVQRTAEALSQHGVVVVVALCSGGEFRPSGYTTKCVRIPAYVRHRRWAVIWFWFHVLVAAFKIRPTIVYAHDYYMSLVGLITSYAVGARLVYDAHELIIPSPDLPKRLRRTFWYNVEALVVKHCDLIIAANERRAIVMQQHYDLPRRPTVVRNIPPEPTSVLTSRQVWEQFPPVRKHTRHEVILVYQGVLSRSRGIHHFVRALGKLPEVFSLIVVGDGPGLEELRRQVCEECLNRRVRFVGRVERHYLFDIMRHCDIGIVTYPSIGLNNKYCAPNKIYEYAQAGLPMVATDQPPIAEMFSIYAVGQCVSIGQSSDGAAARIIADAVRDIHANIESYRRALQGFLEDNRWDNESSGLLVELSRLQMPGTV